MSNKVNSIKEKTNTAHHETDLKESLGYLPRTFDIDILCKALKEVYGDDGYEIAKEWISVESKNVLPRNFDEFWENCSLTPYQEAEFDQFLKNNIYDKADYIGWTPKALRRGKNSKKPPSETKRKELEESLEAPKKLKENLTLLKDRNKPKDKKTAIEPCIVNMDGACYFHPYMKKSDIPENRKDYLYRLNKIVDCEVRTLEAIEYITRNQGRKADEKQVCYKLELNNQQGKRVISEVTHEELTTRTRFSSFLVSKGFIKFRGTSEKFDQFHEFIINGQDYKTLRQMSSWGEYEPGKFLFENGLYDTSRGELLWADDQMRIEKGQLHIVCPSGTEQVLPPQISPLKNDTEYFLTEKFNLWEEFNGRVNVRVTVGYALACIYSRQILKKLGGYPMLFKFGVRGTGKSTSMDWFMSLFGYKNGNRQSASKQNTNKSILRRLTLPISFPFFLDDFRDHHSDNQSLNLTSNFLNWFHRVGSAMAKKSTDHQTIETPMQATVVMTGNDRPTDEAALSRMIVLDYNRHLKKEKLKRIHEITNHTDRFSEFTHLILKNYDHLKSRFFSALEEHINYLNDQGFEGRTSNNWAIPLAGMECIKYILPGLSHWVDEIEALRNEVCDIIRRQEAVTKQFNPVHEFFNSLEYHATQKADPSSDSFDKSFLIDHRHFRIKEKDSVEGPDEKIIYDGPTLAIHLKNCWSAMQDVNASITREVSLQQVMTHLEKSSYYLDKSAQVLLTRSLSERKESNRRCYRLNVNELVDKGFLSELIEKAREYEQKRPERLVP